MLLSAYPKAFRDRYSDELVAFWTAQRHERRYRGWLGGARYAARLTLDAVGSGLRTRWVETSGKEGMMKSVWTDGRLARRALSASPLFAVVAIVTIALGIGATTAVYAIVEGVVLRPLPYPDADRLVRVMRTSDPGQTQAVSWPDFRDWRDQAIGFEGLAAYTEAGGAFEWTEGAEEASGARVTRNFFDVLGVPLTLGRTFSEEEDEFGGPDAIIISHGLWVSRYGADPNVLDRTLPYDGSEVPIVGVAPAGLDAPYEKTRYWIPMQDDQLLQEVGLPTGGRSLNFLNVLGRLESGADGATVGRALRSLAHRIDESAGRGVAQRSNVGLVPYDAWLVGDVGATLFLLLAAAGLVLVVAGANVAGLALSRSAARSREIAVRSALGASRGRLLRQLLTESMLVCGVAGALGLALASLLLSGVMRFAPPGLPRADEVSITPSTLLFAVAATLASGVVVGLFPSWRASRAEFSTTLARGGRSSGGRRALRPQQLLVSFQVAIAVVLMTGAALLTSSFARLLQVERGFVSDGVIVATIAPSAGRYDSPEAVSEFYASLLNGVRALPGVAAASTTYSPPMFGNEFRTSIAPEGVEEDAGDPLVIRTVIIGDDYFGASGIPLLSGRDFTPADRLGEPVVVVVNETMAERLWPGEDPLGKRFEFTGGIQGSADSFDPAFFPDEPMTVVGVAGDVRRSSLAEEPRPEYYRSHAQLPWIFQYLVVRASGDPLTVAERLRDVVWGVDPTVPVRDVRTLDAQLSESIGAYRFRMLLLLVFAGLTCILSMVGLYSVMTLAVTRRVREMGIRLALGASSGTVVRGVLAHGLRLIGWGTLLGVALAWFAGRGLSEMLFDVEATDAPTYVLVVLLIGSVGLLGCYLPAHRAGRVDPVMSLQEE